MLFSVSEMLVLPYLPIKTLLILQGSDQMLLLSWNLLCSCSPKEIFLSLSNFDDTHSLSLIDSCFTDLLFLPVLFTVMDYKLLDVKDFCLVYLSSYHSIWYQALHIASAQKLFNKFKKCEQLRNLIWIEGHFQNLFFTLARLWFDKTGFRFCLYLVVYTSDCTGMELPLCFSLLPYLFSGAIRIVLSIF